jgi:type VI secretion system protein ImpG
VSEVEYFEREYNYLQSAGEEFAEKHKAIGGLLRLSERQRKDPFVERLMEAFAFLCGRIHERLDDDIPEFANGLLEQLFPHLLRPFPSCAILQARVIGGAITEPVLVKKGSEIQTRVGAYEVRFKVSAGSIEKGRTEEIREPAEFIFRTTQNCFVYPMKITKITQETNTEGESELNIQFQLNRNVTYANLNLKRLCFYIQGDYRSKYTLLLYLTKYLKSVAVRELHDQSQESQFIQPYHLHISGLNYNDEENEQTAIIPYARQAFDGYRILQEYFSFPERFFFLNLDGLDQFNASSEGYPFEVKMIFNRQIPKEFHYNENNILINCVPIVNLFDRPTEPVQVTRRMPEYYIIPDADRRKSREIYAIQRVVGVERDKKTTHEYTPITSYDVLDINQPEYKYKRFYSVVFRQILGDMGESYIRLFGPSLEQEEFPEEILSIDSIMSNGFLPSKYVQVGHVNQPVNFPEGLTATNLTAPSSVLPCPIRKNYLWALISHLTVSLTSLAETQSLKSVLGLYNWSIEENNPNRKKIHEGIVKVNPPVPKSIFKNRALLRGLEINIDVDHHQFEHGDGDIHLFGLILNKFLSQYVTINTFAELSFKDVETKKKYIWMPNLGKMSAI